MGGETSMASSWTSMQGTKAQTESQERAQDIAYEIAQQQMGALSPFAQSGAANLARLNYALYGDANLPTADQMQVHGEAYEQAIRKFGDDKWGQPIYKNPFTGELTIGKPPEFDTDALFGGIQGGGINPSARFGMADWQASPEYQAFANARDASLNRTTRDLAAQAGASGMYGSGNVANALAQNIGQTYAAYDPASLAAARNAWNAGRTQEFNMLAGLANPNAAAQINTYAGNYGTAAQNAQTNIGNAQAQNWANQGNAFNNASSGAWGAAQNMLQYQQSRPTTSSMPSSVNTGYAPYTDQQAWDYADSGYI